MNASARPQWGHPILTPDGEEIRLPQFAFGKLRLRGLLLPNRNQGLYQISDLVYALIEPEYDGIMDGLRKLLGMDLSGPDWLICTCRECQRLAEDQDKTSAPEGPKRGRYWLTVNGR